MRRLLPGLLVVAQTPVSTAGIPDGFAPSLRCPFAKVWLEHGAEEAARMLGVDEPHRRLEDVVWGTCNYNNPYAGGAMCVEMRGAAWTDDSADAKCKSVMPGSPGTAAKGQRCATSVSSAGWCSTESGTMFTLSAKSPTCEAAAKSCVQYSAGTFINIGDCAPATGSPSGDAGGAGAGGAGAGAAPMRCLLAPGPMGAAHQLTQSLGYDVDCEGAPASKSPYMWPLRWTSEVEQQGLSFASDEVQYESRGRVWYMLDKNYKRLDLWSQSGVQRAVGQAPCEGERISDKSGAFACNRTADVRRTVLHRGSKMVFIERSADDNITNCTWLDLGPIGNIRPDWFMDNRGASTSVQYMGDSHVYYRGKPRLVKQWRKKDFANQYFTMSMARLPDSNGTHWPLILNIPGEGFGDDFLQHWHGHRLLQDSDEGDFLVDEQYEKAGGKCVFVGGSGGQSGPPTGQVDPVPSNLEVQAEAWREIEWTESPVWKPEVKPEVGPVGGAKKIVEGVYEQTCWDSKSSSVQVSLAIDMEKPVYLAVGFRDTEECLMTPRGGADGEVVVALPGASQSFEVMYGPLSPGLKTMGSATPANVAAFSKAIKPLSAVAAFAGGSAAELSNGKFSLAFKRAYQAKPEALHLTFATGLETAFGYHGNRGCFKVENLPECPPAVCVA